MLVPIKPIPPNNQEPWLHRVCYIEVDTPYGRKTHPAVIVACWPGERFPVARVRVLCNGELFDTDATNIEFPDGKTGGEKEPNAC